MRPALEAFSAMSSPPQAVAHGRPWTPPDTDSEYFSDPFKAGSAVSNDLDNGWPLSPATPSASFTTSERPKPTSSATDPYPLGLATPDKHARGHETRADFVDTHTPIATSRTPDPPLHNDIPRYPYTPDSARTTKKYTLPPLSPLPPMPWNAQTVTSPVQNALSSCITHLENLISTRQPDDDQMEYLLTKFEEMASYLSAPEAQSRQSDDHLFAELDLPLNPSGLGITNVDDDRESKDMSLSESYVLEVGKYIEGVKKSTEDLQMRMDEVKQLNSIQYDIIGDLRAQLKSKEDLQKTKKELNATPRDQNHRSRQPTQRTGFWVAVAEALDSVGEMLFEY